MQTRTIGQTGIRLSEVTLGTWGLATSAYGEQIEPSRFEAVVKTAWEHGVTTFDVAPLWGDGASEWRTAAALGDFLRDAIFITRVGQQQVNGKLSNRFDAQGILESVDASLRRLGRDRLDVLLLHQAPVKVLASDIFRKGIEHLRMVGKIGAWGASVTTLDEARAALAAGAQTLCLAHHLLDPHLLGELDTDLPSPGASVLVRSPLCYGLLSGTWSADRRFSENDHRSRRWDAASLAARVGQLEECRFLVQGEVPDLATASLRYALSSPRVASLCVGARTPEQIAHAARASRPAPLLPPRDLERLDAVARERQLLIGDPR
jgi:aryl-alcohol dehydrogenase-like predicted oxidoreductase